MLTVDQFQAILGLVGLSLLVATTIALMIKYSELVVLAVVFACLFIGVSWESATLWPAVFATDMYGFWLTLCLFELTMVIAWIIQYAIRNRFKSNSISASSVRVFTGAVWGILPIYVFFFWAGGSQVF